MNNIYIAFVLRKLVGTQQILNLKKKTFDFNL